MRGYVVVFGESSKKRKQVKIERKAKQEKDQEKEENRKLLIVGLLTYADESMVYFVATYKRNCS